MAECTYSIFVNGKRQVVSEAVYKAHHKLREREKYLRRLSLVNERSLERFEEDCVNAEYKYSLSQPSLEDEVIHRLELEKLYSCIQKLDADEIAIINGIFLDGKNESAIASLQGVHQSSINRKRQKFYQN